VRAARERFKLLTRGLERAQPCQAARSGFVLANMEKLTLGELSSRSSLPICYDLYCGLGGWAEGFLSEGFRCIGYDIEKHDYGTGTYPGELILADVRSIHGSQIADAACIVASPPCQEPSYRAMPWKRAKALNAIGPPHNFIELFNACFRIQREASEAAGRYIPLVVENVVGAQRWVGRARWHFGSYYLWGDVPALMPLTLKLKVPGFRFDGSGRSFQTAAVNHTKNDGGSWFNVAHNTTSGKGQNPDGRKVSGDWFGSYEEMKAAGTISPGRLHGKNSQKRKAASAEIAKIPFPLAQWIARCYKPAVPASVPRASLPSSGQAGVSA
jgi:hypothetical protein